MPFEKNTTFTWIISPYHHLNQISISMSQQKPTRLLPPILNHGSRKLFAKISKISFALVTWTELIPSQIIALWLQLMSTSRPGLVGKDATNKCLLEDEQTLETWKFFWITKKENGVTGVENYLNDNVTMYIYIYLWGKIHLVSNSRHISSPLKLPWWGRAPSNCRGTLSFLYKMGGPGWRHLYKMECAKKTLENDRAPTYTGDSWWIEKFEAISIMFGGHMSMYKNKDSFCRHVPGLQNE